MIVGFLGFVVSGDNGFGGCCERESVGYEREREREREREKLN